VFDIWFCIDGSIQHTISDCSFCMRCYPCQAYKRGRLCYIAVQHVFSSGVQRNPVLTQQPLSRKLTCPCFPLDPVYTRVCTRFAVQHQALWCMTHYMSDSNNEREPDVASSTSVAISCSCRRHCAHISLQRINPHTIHRTRKITVCCTVALQAVVAEHMPARERNKRHQNVPCIADRTRPQRSQQLSYAVTTPAVAAVAACIILLQRLLPCLRRLLRLLRRLLLLGTSSDSAMLWCWNRRQREVCHGVLHAGRSCSIAAACAEHR
jgi:hypothetical protein